MAHEFEKKKKFGMWRLLSYLFAFFLIVIGILPILNMFGVTEYLLPAIPQLIANLVLVIAGILILYHMWT